eukprot:50580_1
MDDPISTGWTFQGAYRESISAVNCPDTNPPKCSRLGGYEASTSIDSAMDITIDVSEYTNLVDVSVQYDVSLSTMPSGKRCYLYYAFDDDPFVAAKYHTSSGVTIQTYYNQSVTIPDHTDTSYENLTIRFLNNALYDNEYCYIDNVYVFVGDLLLDVDRCDVFDSSWTNGGGSISHSNDCPRGSSDTCIYLYNDWVIKTFDIRRYNNLIVAVDLSMYWADYCGIGYFYDDEPLTSLGTVYGSGASGYTKRMNQKFIIPDSTMCGSSTLSIRFYTTSSWRCLIDNIVLLGNVLDTANPTKHPTSQTLNPSYPTQHPTNTPTLGTHDPSFMPTVQPSTYPTVDPTTNDPTVTPTANPSIDPTTVPTLNPTEIPTKRPSANPTMGPTEHPSANPTMGPTYQPSANPTKASTSKPTKHPSANPTMNPTNPSIAPTVTPTSDQTTDPTNDPTFASVLTTDPTLPTFIPSAGDLTKYPTVKATFITSADDLTKYPTPDHTFIPSAGDLTKYPTVKATFITSADDLTKYPTPDHTFIPSAGDITKYPTVKATFITSLALTLTGIDTTNNDVSYDATLAAVEDANHASDGIKAFSTILIIIFVLLFLSLLTAKLRPMFRVKVNNQKQLNIQVIGRKAAIDGNNPKPSKDEIVGNVSNTEIVQLQIENAPIEGNGVERTALIMNNEEEGAGNGKTGDSKEDLEDLVKRQKEILAWFEDNDELKLLKESKMKYYNLFMKEGYDQMVLIAELTRDDLIAIGIEKRAHQNQIIKAVEVLKQEFTWC